MSDVDKLRGKKLCFTSEGKYVVDGVDINFDDAEIPLDKLNKLEASPMTQLDAFYLRKRIHHLSNSMMEYAKENELNAQKADKIQKELTHHERDCFAEKIPELVNNSIHAIVNGKMDKIFTSLSEIKITQTNNHTALEEYKIFQETKHLEIIEKIETTLDRTIFGWIRNKYESQPLKTLLVSFIVSIVIFLFTMFSLHIKSFSEFWDIIKGWLP